MTAKGLIWVGSDDGLVHLTRDGGKHWDNVTPKGMPEWIQINSIDASRVRRRHRLCGGHRVQAGRFPAVPVQDQRLRQDLDQDRQRHSRASLHARGARRPQPQGLLIAGTEFGLYISYDDGANWKPFQLNLPIVPIADVAFHKREKDLVIATQGRAFYVLDDVPLLYQVNDSVTSEDAHLFKPKDTYRMGGGRGFGGRGGGAASAKIRPAAP